MLEVVRVELDGFAPAEAGEKKHERADRVEVAEGVEGEAALDAGGRVAEAVGNQGVGEFVDRDGDHKGECIEEEKDRAGEEG